MNIGTKAVFQPTHSHLHYHMIGVRFYRTKGTEHYKQLQLDHFDRPFCYNLKPTHSKIGLLLCDTFIIFCYDFYLFVNTKCSWIKEALKICGIIILKYQTMHSSRAVHAYACDGYVFFVDAVTSMVKS